MFLFYCKQYITTSITFYDYKYTLLDLQPTSKLVGQFYNHMYQRWTT